MAQTIKKTIGGIFSDYDDAAKAIKALDALAIPGSKITKIDTMSEKPVGFDLLQEFPIDRTRCCDGLIRKEKTLVIVSNVVDVGPITKIFNEYDSDQNQWI